MYHDMPTLLAEMERLAPWYHKIDLGNGIVTPGYDFENVWNNIRKTRSLIDYQGKTVLDIANWDGMWSFEAERLGASQVVAAETCYKKLNNFLFCRQILGSHAIPFYNISSCNLSERLDVCFAPYGGYGSGFEGFDIVQHLGLLYHLSDPLHSLMETRSVMKAGGIIILETAYVEADAPVMLFQGVVRNEGRIYPEDHSTWWAPSLSCLDEMLRTCLLEPITESRNLDKGSSHIGRVCMACRALPLDDTSKSRQLLDMGRTWRSRGPSQIQLGGC